MSRIMEGEVYAQATAELRRMVLDECDCQCHRADALTDETATA